MLGLPQNTEVFTSGKPSEDLSKNEKLTQEIVYISQEGELNFETSVVQNKPEKTILMALQALNSTYLFMEKWRTIQSLQQGVAICFLMDYRYQNGWNVFFYSFTKLMVA